MVHMERFGSPDLYVVYIVIVSTFAYYILSLSLLLEPCLCFVLRKTSPAHHSLFPSSLVSRIPVSCHFYRVRLDAVFSCAKKPRKLYFGPFSLILGVFSHPFSLKNRPRSSLSILLFKRETCNALYRGSS